MTNRRTFLGTAIAATAATGGAKLAGGAGEAAETVAFYARTSGAATSAVGLFDGGHAVLEKPERVEQGSVALGHFHGLVRDDDGKVSYVYEASLPDRRHGYVKLDEAASSAFV